MEPRVGKVAIDSVFSEVFTLENTIFQGTVLGPCLWNVFFQDVSSEASARGGQEAMFADDLNVFEQFDATVNNEVIKTELALTQQNVHRWGRRNRVSFDEKKEHVAIIHPIQGEGETFRFLGCMIDVKLQMDDAIDHIVTTARPKIKALLRSRGTYDVKDMLCQFKTHIWGITEFANGAILHASKSSLNRLDNLQSSFLRDLGISEYQAFMEFNFAPAALRRDIGILGFLHKRSLELCHPGIMQFLPMNNHASQGHDKQTAFHLEKCIGRHQLYFRSLFGKILAYNRLPQCSVNASSVKSFQSELTKIARLRCEKQKEDWQSTFHNEVEIWKTRQMLAWH